MSPTLLTALVAVGIVALLAIALRSFGGRRSETVEMPSTGPSENSYAEVVDDDDEELVETETETGEPIPITSEGIAIVPDGKEVRLIPLVHSEDELPDWIRDGIEASSVPYSVINRFYLPAAAHGMKGTKPGSPLNAGDFDAARIRPGVAGAYAWRLETLGRDGDFGFFPFSSENGARAALEILESHQIVRRPADEDDQPTPASDEDFEEARLRYEASERALAVETDEDDAPGPGDWSSRR